jgi:hypothetical protein
VGVLHVGALPGTPRHHEGLDAIAARAIAEARAYASAGFDALILENMHDRPYLRRAVGPEIVASMAAIGREVHKTVPLPLGVQVLAGANQEALAVALASGADFVRVEGFVFAHVADEGVIQSDAGDLLRYRKAIGADRIRVFTDVKKKHASHALTADVDLASTARAAEFFLADGLVVTGSETGVPASADDVSAAREAVAVPVLVGSGITPDNLARYAAADGYIVGSSVKEGGHWSGPVDPARLDALVAAYRALPRPDAR